MTEEPQPLSQSEAEALKKDQNHPGKVAGEGAGPTEAAGGAGGEDLDSAATGSGPSGGGDAGGATGGSADSAATGDGPSGGG